MAAPLIEQIVLLAEALKCASGIHFSITHLTTMVESGFENISKAALIGPLVALVSIVLLLIPLQTDLFLFNSWISCAFHKAYSRAPFFVPSCLTELQPFVTFVSTFSLQFLRNLLAPL